MSELDILKVEEIATILLVSKNTIHRKSWRKKNGCPLKKVGKRLLAYRKDFESWFRGLNG